MIQEFNGKYSWLSNFEPCDIELFDIIYPSVEHAFQSAKSNDIEWKNFCQKTKSPGLVKKESRKQKLIDDWNNKRLEIMFKCLVQKFTQEKFKQLLLETNDEYLQEGNYWGDKFWGVCLKTNTGENILGKMLMKIRNQLKT